MDLKQFIERNPYLYHLTSKQNAELIIKQLKLFSTNELIDMSKDRQNAIIKTKKRFAHQAIIIEGNEIMLRDQRPISEKALSKCLTDNWTVGDFLHHLNDRVFMWPTLERLTRHFNRYESEKPVIFRFSTKDILEANSHVKFARLNTGATRANSYLGGKAPARGPKTFLSANEYTLSVASVAEVTFDKVCNVAGNVGIDFHPTGKFDKNLNSKK